MRRLLFAAPAAALAASGCGGGSSACLAGADTAPRTAPATAAATAHLTGVAVSRAGCADRVELRFADGARPRYRIEYLAARRAQTEDASGRHIDVAGAAFLVVRLSGAATARSDGATLTRTYTGPRRLRPDGARHVREVVKTGDFEAVVTWTIGLDERRPFRVEAAERSLAILVE